LLATAFGSTVPPEVILDKCRPLNFGVLFHDTKLKKRDDSTIGTPQRQGQDGKDGVRRSHPSNIFLEGREDQ
jgi:hypothetical protein